MIPLSETPAWPTGRRSRLRDGRLMGTDNSVWLYKAVPMSPIADARDTNEQMSAALPIFAAINELAVLTNISVQRRALSKGNYRQIHMLMVNIPRLYRPPHGHPLAPYLRDQYANTRTNKRLLLFGVKLKDRIGGDGSLKSAIDSIAETLISGTTPLSDYDEDTARVNGALTRAGLIDVPAEDIAIANAWWNHGENPDTPTLIHADHVHIFDSAESVRLARAAGVERCGEWDPRGETPVPGQHAITFASVQAFDMPFLDPASSAALWMSDLVQSGAISISVRGSIEPGTVTRQELRRQKKRFIDDIDERLRQGKMERAEQQEMLQMLSAVEDMYATGGGSAPTLAGTSIVVGLSGAVRDITQVAPGSAASLSYMTYRQMGAMAETMLCSNVRANPNMHDLPAQVIAASGAPSLSFVGDEEGVLVGFTERDRQASFLSPTAASSADALPLLLLAGQTGGGKTLAGLHLIYQAAQMGIPSVFVDPKAVTLDTVVQTPLGPVPMGDIEVGQQVIGRDGKPCNVTHKSRVFTTDETRLFEFTFSDGQKVKADANHQWLVYDQGEAEAYLQWVAEDGVDAVLSASKREAAERAERWYQTGATAEEVEAVRLSGDAPLGAVLTTDGVIDMMTFPAPLFVPVRTGSTDDEYGFDFVGITSVREIGPEPAQCIRVDSPDHTYVIADSIVTHNTGSDHGPIVRAAGGQVASLDTLAASDGIFDPIRFAASTEVGVELASSMLMAVNPWGTMRDDFEVPLQHALAHGVNKGARCIGEALNIAEADLGHSLPPEMIRRIRDLSDSSPMFRAIAGQNPATEGLRVSNGITLIKVGDSFLDLPEPGALTPTLSQRIALALVRMMVFGSAMALTGRGGMVMLDEAWVFLGAGRSEVERLGRLARSQQVLPVLMTQRVSDAVDAGLSGFISRGLILPIADKSEAVKACELFNLQPTPQRIARLTARETMGGTSNQAVQPNWGSMRHLKDPVTGRTLRGSVAIYTDLNGRAIPVEITLPPEFLNLASTNPDDIRRREAEQEKRRAMAQAQSHLDTQSGSGGGVAESIF